EPARDLGRRNVADEAHGVPDTEPSGEREQIVRIPPLERARADDRKPRGGPTLRDSRESVDQDVVAFSGDEVPDADDQRRAAGSADGPARGIAVREPEYRRVDRIVDDPDAARLDAAPHDDVSQRMADADAARRAAQRGEHLPGDRRLRD